MSTESKLGNEDVNDRLIELTDETGEKIVFEHLDTIEHAGRTFFMLTEYYEEEPEESDVYVMELVNGEDSAESLELVEDNGLVNTLFELFKSRAEDEFEFLD